jgi:DNA modification methylase
MVGGGTTLIEAKLLNRKSLGIDINPLSVEISKKNINFKGNFLYEPSIEIGDIRNLKNIQDNTIDLVLTHPPYLNIIKYSNGDIDGDLSQISGLKKFCDEFEKGIRELYRILKPDHYCAILIGDTRKSRHYVPLSYYIMERFLQNGFVLKEDIIKAQHNCSTTPYWKTQSKKYNIFLIMHEHLFIFRKPKKSENLSYIKYSTMKKKNLN